MKKRDRQQFIKTLKNYNLYTTFRLIVSEQLFFRQLNSYHTLNQKKEIRNIINTYLQIYGNKSTKQLVNVLQRKKEKYLHVNNHKLIWQYMNPF